MKKWIYALFGVSLCLVVFVIQAHRETTTITAAAITTITTTPTVTETPLKLNTTNNDDKTLSPYFFVKSESKGVDQLPLLQTNADVNIAGVIADVKITQVYKNDSDTPLEATYLLPASTRAAVYDMRMTIGKRVIQAKIEEKKKARADYEQAKKEGKRASLLEQHKPNVFQMNVANIMPGDIIKVELFYTELLVPEEGIYEFVYPTVVGPRYSDTPKELASTDEKSVDNPYLEEGKLPTYLFDINVNLKTGVPLQGIIYSSHKIEYNFKDKDRAVIGLHMDACRYGKCNKDFVLQYKLKGKEIQNGVLMYEGEKENFFLLMAQPQKQVKAKEIPPREYIFILDVSGSMHGFPLDVAKETMKKLLNDLRPEDKFNVLFFSGGNWVLSEKSLSATPSNISMAITEINKNHGGGGTELLPALQNALAMKGVDGYARSFIAVTDGYVTVEEKTFELIRDNLGEANFFAFGIGSSVNRFLIEGMARVGYGEPLIILNESEAAAKTEKFRKYIQTPVLTDISVNFGSMKVYDVEPKAIPDLLAERPLVMFGKYKKGTGNSTITIRGKTGGRKNFEQKIKVDANTVAKENRALRSLWARHKIQQLGDYNELRHNDNRVKEITNLGLKYNLLTKYTSFIAIDNVVVNDGGESTKVKQPLPLPEGVSKHAVSKMTPPRTSAPPPPPPIIETIPDEEIEEEIKMEDQSVDDKTASPSPPPRSKPKRKPKSKESEFVIEEVFTVVEQMPRFPGCEHKGSNSEKKTCAEKLMLEFIYKNIQYPSAALNNGVSGTVVIRFIVDEKGRITNAEILRDIGAGCGKEALRVVNKMNELPSRWTPGMQRNRPVKVQFNLPIRFKGD